MKLSHVVLAVVLLVAFATSVHAQWSPWNALTADVVDDDAVTPGAADDGADGVVVVWSDYADHLVYATRYNENGTVNWEPAPVPVGPIDNSTYVPLQVVRQGSSWFVAWFDPDDVDGVHMYKIRIAKLNSIGDVVASTSVAVAEVDEAVDVIDLTLVARTGGGVALGWRIEGVGHARLFPSDLSSNVNLGTFEGEGDPSGNINLFRLVADGSDGVFTIWGQHELSYHHVTARRYNSSGVPQWNDDTVVVDRDGYPSDISVAGDGSGGFVAAVQWESYYGSILRVQHVSSSGMTSWNDNAYTRGKTLYFGCQNQLQCPDQVEPRIVVNHSQGAAIISWYQYSGGASIHAQKIALDGPFALSWDPEGPSGIRVNVGSYLEIGTHRITSNIDDQTIVAWPYRTNAYTVAGVNFQILGDDGDVEMDTDKEVIAPVPGSIQFVVPTLVSQPIGAYTPLLMYLENNISIYTFGMLPPLFYDIEYSYNEEHCSTPISWRTLTGSSQNKLKYRRTGTSNWSTKNASGSGSAWSSSLSAYTQMEFKMTAVFGTAPMETQNTYQQYYYCGPDPTSPMPEERVTEAYLNAHPNPFNPQVTMDYGVPAISRVELAIFDASGRLIKTLVSGTKPAGSYSETWDGTGERGGRVASGVYFSRLSVGGKSLTRKLVMLK